ncbi:MAG: PqiC family protein [Pseudomonadota bacterium]
MIATRLLPLLLLALLVSCAGNPVASTQYLLPADSAAAASAAVEPSRVLVVRPLQIADFLNDEGIVLQLDDITLNQATTNRWAEQPAMMLQRGLRQRLANRLPDVEVMDANTRAGGDLQLLVEVNSFQGTHNGDAVAAGQWQLRDASGEVILQRSFQAVTRLDNDGYPALVRALGRSWDQVATDIAAGIAASR